MWLRHWQLAMDPFSATARGYIATPAHEDALASLSHQFDGGAAVVSLRGSEGSGRRTLAREWLVRMRSPSRRGIMFAAPFDLPRGMQRALGQSLRGPHSGDPWASIVDGIRVLRLESRSLLVCVEPGIEGESLERLLVLARSWPRTIAVLRLTNNEDEADSIDVTLRTLTRSEAAGYLGAKLHRAGRDRPAFSAQAIARLHADAGGLPGRIDRLAGLSLVRSAQVGERLVSLELVQQVCREAGPAGWYEHRHVG